MAKVKCPLTITLTEQAFKKIIDQVEGEGEDAQKFALFTQEAMEAIGKGAMLLPSDTAARLSDIDESLNDPEAIVNAVEKGMGVHQGLMVAHWEIDPALHEPLRQRADVQGMTVDRLVQEMMDNAVAMGWFFDLEARVNTWFFEREKWARLQVLMGEDNPTVDSLLSRLEPEPVEVVEATKLPAAESELGQDQEVMEFAE